MKIRSGIKSQLVVLTGSLISGKTEVGLELEKRGFQFVPEAARIYIDNELARGLTKEVIRSNEGDFQRSILRYKLRTERELQKNKLYFLDRAMPDSISYYRVAGLNPKEIWQLCKLIVYKKIFIFDLLPDEIAERILQDDKYRTENLRIRKYLDRQLEQDYCSLGYDVSRIPFRTITERVELVLKQLNLW